MNPRESQAVGHSGRLQLALLSSTAQNSRDTFASSMRARLDNHG
jgi:hypothetical protein